MKKIAVVYGGFSSEIEISRKSGLNVVKSLDRTRYDVYGVFIGRNKWCVEMEDGREFPVDRSDFSVTVDGRKVRFDDVLIFIHGDPGETGILQAYFDMVGQKYVGSTSLTTTIAFDKFACKRYLAGTGVLMAKEALLRRGETFSPEEMVEKLGLPLFVKPNNGGSSFGVTKVKRVEDIPAAVDKAFKEGDTLIMESAISGREIDCGVWKDGDDVHALPVVEIISENEYFDYEAKYCGKSKEVCPADIPEKMRIDVQEAAIKIFKRLGCTGMVRMDFIANQEGAFFLEVNLTPGMTAESLIPKMVRAAGMNLTDYLTSLIEQ